MKKIIAGSVFASAALLFASCGSGDDKPTTTDSVKAVAAAPKPGDSIKWDNTKRYIFLTWDDAPQPPGTKNCMKIFRDEGVKATFFMVGFNSHERSRDRILDTIRNSYPQFLLANHSYSHGFNDHYQTFYKMVDSASNDFVKNEQKYNIPVKIIRLPGNNAWIGKDVNKGPNSTKGVREKLGTMGYTVIGWDLEWNFRGNAPKESATEMVNAINKRFDEDYTQEAGAIVILAHDRMFGKQQYADSLTKFVQMLKQDPRNVFETLDHYPLVTRSK